MRMSILKQSLIFSGIVLFGGIVLAQMIVIGLNRTPMTTEDEESKPSDNGKLQSTSESTPFPHEILAPVYEKAARVVVELDRIKRNFKLPQRHKETSHSPEESKQGS